MKRDRADEATAALRRELTINPKHDAARTLLNELHLRLPSSGDGRQETGDQVRFQEFNALDFCQSLRALPSHSFRPPDLPSSRLPSPV